MVPPYRTFAHKRGLLLQVRRYSGLCGVIRKQCRSWYRRGVLWFLVLRALKVTVFSRITTSSDCILLPYMWYVAGWHNAIELTRPPFSFDLSKSCEWNGQAFCFFPLLKYTRIFVQGNRCVKSACIIVVYQLFLGSRRLLCWASGVAAYPLTVKLSSSQICST